MPARTASPPRSRPGLAATALLSLLLGLGGCPKSSPPLDGGQPPGAFYAPQGIAATSRYVLVVSSAFHFEEGQPSYARGWLTVIERSGRRIADTLPLSRINPQHLAVAGERAYVVSSGGLHRDSSGLVTASSDGALDLFDFSAGVPAGPASSLVLPRSSSDPRIGAYDRIALGADGKRAFLGSGTRGDLFVVDLDGGLRLRRGPEEPLAIFPTAPGKNGFTVPVSLGAELAVLDFNSDALCVIGDPGGELAKRRCQTTGAYPDLLEGPIDLAAGPSGELLVLMNLANGLYRVDARTPTFAVDPSFARAGLAPNRVVVHGGYAYVVNSLSNNLERLELGSRRVDLPFAVLPVGSDPYDLCVTLEPEGPRGWVTLHAANQVAVVDLQSGGVLELLSSSKNLDAGPGGEARLRDGGTSDVRSCADGGAPVVGIEDVVTLQLGPGGGTGQDRLPAVIRGAPGGPGSSDETLSLGVGGEIVVDFGDYDIVDGPGPDFIVFENPFLLGPCQSYAEPAVVGLSAGDAAPTSFVDFPCALSRSRGDPQQQRWAYPGCAGVHPVLAAKTSCTAPSAAAAGGDAFDLATLGIKQARYLRLRDAGISTMGDGTKGFDLDAVVLLHYTKR